MAFGPGARFGSFEILSIIGEGGMGRVYRARDLKLQRIVAVKVLPDSVAGDPERIARFEREARTLATLNHPHIAQVYGLEDTGTSHALLMECVEGEDLAQRIERGPIPWRDALPIARQIADALQAAHEQGIVHRDLKPANVKLTADGAVKVLDFGLAKPFGELPAVGAGATRLADSPTITSPAVTQIGVILGTAAYMSPEQAKGRAADKRSDVWSFGCVVFEMLSGKRAFPGDDVMGTLAAVVGAEPDFSSIPSDIPAHVRALIEQCLIKDRRERVADLAAARYALGLQTPRAVVQPSSRSAWAVAVVAMVISIGLALFSRRPTEPQQVVRSEISAHDAAALGFATIAISRQGTHLAYASSEGVMVRALSEMTAHAVKGGESGANPFFSYDGQSIGFFAGGKLKRVPVSGGAAQALAEAPSGRGGSWGADGTIVFAPGPEGGLYRVSENGGEVTTITKPRADERSHRWPHLLPGDRTVLFTIQPAGKTFDDAVIASVPASGGEPQIVLEGGSFPQYAASGHLIFGRAGTLLSRAFNVATGRADGNAITVVENVVTTPLNGAVPYAVSSNGTLLYLPGRSALPTMAMLRASRTGQTEVLFDRRLIGPFRIAPDGQRVAVSINDGQEDIWLLDLKQQPPPLSRFTFGNGTETMPVWSPDGQRLFYASNSTGLPTLVSKPIDGGQETTRVFQGNAFFQTTISHDGTVLLGRGITSGSSFDVTMLRVSGTDRPSPFLASPANEMEATFSPDGRHVAFQSDETGRNEIFVQAFPSGGKWQITTTGGTDPRWTLGGRELIYRSGPTIVAVPITLQPFAHGQARTLFGVPNLVAFDVTADGQRFVVRTQDQNPEDVNFALITGWVGELRSKMAGAR